jgi:hypothetical protein
MSYYLGIRKVERVEVFESHEHLILKDVSEYNFCEGPLKSLEETIAQSERLYGRAPEYVEFRRRNGEPA